MSGVNKVIIVGNLGKDPEVRYSGEGKAVCKFSVAVNSRAGGEEVTEWFNVVTFDKQAENCGQFLSKGRQVYVEGRLQTRTYEKDGQTKYFTEVVAYTVQFLSGGDSQAKGNGSRGHDRDGLKQRAPSSGGYDEALPF